MPIGTIYSYGYNHARKEIYIRFQIGTTPPFEVAMGVEAFLQDIKFVKNDKQLAHFLAIVKERKDLPVDYDFGPSGGEIRFDPKDWENKMGEG